VYLLWALRAHLSDRRHPYGCGQAGVAGPLRSLLRVYQPLSR
jgi:hypothetical protein